MKKKILWIIAFVFAAVLAISLAACGDKGNGGNTSASETTSEAPASESEKPSESTSTVDPAGDGSKDNPYIIKTADDLLDFADRINDTEDVDFDYAQSFFRLDADIDMADEKYIPAGKPIDDSGDDDLLSYGGFSGSFDGNGHKISNLTITQNMRKSNTVYYVGLFGYTDKANIFDLTLENISYTIESMSSDSSTGVYVGGAVGYGVLTNLVNVKVSGTIETKLLDANAAYIGGLVGEYEVYDKNQSYIAYVRNCVASVETVIGKFDDGEESALENAANGGLIGTISCMKGAAAIVNSVSDGKVYGGEFVGGLIGYSSGSNVSVVNCINYASVRATAKEVSYTGGLIGSSRNDLLVIDCYSAGNVVGVKATSATYRSFAGGIFGYSYADDYDGYYSAGVASENVYFGGSLRTYDTQNTEGTKIDKANVTEAWFKETLRLSADEWTFDGGKAVPKDYDGASGSYKLSLYANGELVKEIDKPYNELGFSIVGTLDDPANYGTNIFFDWEWKSGTRYRYYLPVVKDMRLDAKYGDISSLVGTYKGTGDYHGEIDAGVLSLNEDGSLQWITSTVVGGKFTTDGEHIQFVFNNNYGDITGTYSESDSAIKLTIDHGMSATVEYTFIKKDISVFGQYFNDDGDMLAFTDNKVTVYSDKVNNGNGVSANYVIEGDELVLSGKLEDYFTSLKLTLLSDGSLKAQFIGTTSINSVFARLTDVDYSGKGFVGKYYMPYPSTSSDGPYLSTYVLEFAADGTFTYSSKYSVTPGTYNVFNGNMIKFNLEGNISTIYYDEVNGIFFGDYHGGTYSKKRVLITPVSDGELKLFIVGDDERSYIAVTDNHYYAVIDGELNYDAEISAPDGFIDGARITLEGQSYRVKHYIRESKNNGFGLTAIGEEEGEYSYNGAKVVIDGIGNVGGAKKGTYAIFDDLMVIVFEDDEIIGFDYKSAKIDGGVITAKKADATQGVWYEYKTDTETDPENPTVKKYHKLIIDGFGHATYLYNKEFSGEFYFNWGGKNIWKTITETATGIYVEFNENYKVEFNFYYDRQLAYCKNFGNVYKDLKLTKDGYEGTTELPVLPEGVAGMYSGTEKDGTPIVFNLKQDLTGSVKGNPFVSIFDGADTVFFKVDKVSYSFSISKKTLTYGSEAVALTRDGDVEEVIPAKFVGKWSGLFTGYGTTANDNRTIEISSDGKMTYNNSLIVSCTFDLDTNTITGENGDGSYKIVMKWNDESGVMSAEVINDDEDYGLHSITCESMSRI